jgi:hypothetical protein
MRISSLNTFVEVSMRASCRSPAMEAVAIAQESTASAIRVAKYLPAKIRVSIVAVTPYSVSRGETVAEAGSSGRRIGLSARLAISSGRISSGGLAASGWKQRRWWRA